MGGSQSVKELLKVAWLVLGRANSQFLYPSYYPSEYNINQTAVLFEHQLETKPFILDSFRRFL